MKQIFKKLVIAASLLAAGSSYAAFDPHDEWQYVPGSGSGTLTFSQSALDALDASGSYIYTDAGNLAQYDDTTGVVGLTFTGGTGVGDSLATIESIGSKMFIERTVTVKGKVTLDNLITLTDFKIDLATSTISASLTGTNLLNNTVTNYGSGVIYRAASTNATFVETSRVNGVITAQGSGSFVGALKMEEATVVNFANILGISPTGTVADLVRATDWGTTQATGSVRANLLTPAVPEPSTILLMGVGLVGLGLVRGRRAA